jgi:uncharacterized protein with FMN-binding domain
MSKKNHRPQYIPVFSLVMILAAVFTICSAAFTGCSQGDSDTDTDILMPGTYNGKGYGYGGPINVRVTFSDDAITDIVPGKHYETSTLSGVPVAFSKIPPKIIQDQSLLIEADAITGATAKATNAGIIGAVADCVSQFGGEEALNRYYPPKVGLENGTYIIPVQAVQNSLYASMMSPLCYKDGFLEISDTGIYVTFYFIKTTIMGVEISPADIHDFQYDDGTGYKAALSEVYDPSTEVRTVKIKLAHLDVAIPIWMTSQQPPMDKIKMRFSYRLVTPSVSPPDPTDE